MTHITKEYRTSNVKVRRGLVLEITVAVDSGKVETIYLYKDLPGEIAHIPLSIKDIDSLADSWEAIKDEIGI